jgi:hypothetical protein
MKVAARNKEWIKRHPEKYAEYTGRWRKLNPDAASAVTQAYRAQKRNRLRADITADDVQAIHVMQKGKCAYCKSRLGPVTTWTTSSPSLGAVQILGLICS